MHRWPICEKDFHPMAKTNGMLVLKSGLAMAVILAVFSCSVVESQVPANPPPQNVMPAWTAHQQSFRPGYYYWPAYGQKRSDAQYFGTWEDFHKRDNEITGKTNTSTQSATPAASQDAVPASTQNAIPAWTVQIRGFRPGYYYWPGYGQKLAIRMLAGNNMARIAVGFGLRSHAEGENQFALR